MRVNLALNAGSVKTHAWAVLLTGLGLAYALPMVSLLSSMLTASAKVEQDMVSVERTLQFINIPAARDGGVLDDAHYNRAALSTSALHTFGDMRPE